MEKPNELVLTVEEAYAAMFAYLEGIYDRSESDFLGALLGGMCLLPDGSTADPAAWADWEVAVRQVKEQDVDLDINLNSAGKQ